jgi:hypothetical protein
MTGNSTNTTNTNNTITNNNSGTDYKAFEIIHHIVSWASIIGFFKLFSRLKNFI